MKKLLASLILIVSSIGLPFAYSEAPKGPQMSPQDLNAILDNITEKEFNDILNELSKLTPQELEELEREGRRILLESGIDPDTGRPLAQEQAPSTPEPTPTTPQPTVPVVTRELIASPVEIGKMLKAIQTNLSDLRQKAQYHDVLARRLTQWAEALQDLVFYTKVIDKSEHHERLATKEFQSLLQSLQKLYQALKAHEPLIIVADDTASEDDPYVLLHVNTDAPQEEIDAQFERLKQQYNTKKLKRRLVKEGYTQKDISREIKAAELTFSLIKDAYDQISDPQARAAFDKNRSAQQSELTAAVQAHVNALLDTLSNVVYQQGVLDSLQNFLKKYEPEQLAQKQAVESAQTQRKKEQEEAAKQKPALTTGSFDKKRKPAATRYQDSYAGGNAGYYPRDYGTSYGNEYQPYTYPSKDDANKEKEKSPSGGGGGLSSGKKPQTDAEKLEEMRKALEKEDKSKKDAAMKKELEEFRKKSGAAPASETPDGVKLVETFGALCEEIDGALKSDPIRKMSGQVKGGKQLSPAECTTLVKELKLNECFEQLKRISILCDNSTEDQLAKFKPTWQKILDNYTITFKSIIDRVGKAGLTYTLEEGGKVPSHVCKAHELVNKIVTRINMISGLFSLQFKLLIEDAPKAPDTTNSGDDNDDDGGADALDTPAAAAAAAPEEEPIPNPENGDEE